MTEGNLAHGERRGAGLVAWSALGLVALLPLLSQLPFTYSWSYPKLLALQAATLLAWAGLAIFQPVGPRQLLSAAGLGIPMAAILAWSALTISWSQFAWAATRPLINLCYMAAAVVGFAGLLGTARSRARFTAAYGVSAGLACVVYVACRAFATTHMKVFPFDNPNVAATFALMPMAVGASFAISAAAGRIRKSTGIIGGLVALACALTILASHSAAGTAAGLGALALVFISSFRDKKRERMLEALCLLVALVVLWPLLAPELWPGHWIDEQIGPRPAIWQGALVLARESPVAGLGIGTLFAEYTHVFPQAYAAHAATSDIIENAHCVPLHIVVEVGLVGLVLAAWLVFQALRSAKAAAACAGHHERALLRGLVCGGAGMLAQGLVSTSLHQPECSINLVLGLALIAGMAGDRNPRGPSRKPSTLIRAALPVLFACIFVFTAGRGLLSQFYLHQAARDATMRIGKLEKAVRYGPVSVWTLDARQRLAVAHLDRGDPEAALREVLAIDRLAPNLGKIRLNEAELCLNLAQAGEPGRLRQAADAIMSYCRKNPFDESAYGIWLGIVEAAVRSGRPNVARPEEAERLLDLAIGVDSPNLPRGKAMRLKQLLRGALRHAAPNAGVAAFGRSG